jgi:glycosyltransferase involved in cell wall biosynthesis
LTALAAGVPLIVSGDTWQETGRSSLLGLRRLVRRALLRRAAATLPAGSRHKSFFAAEGARPDHMLVRQLTVDVEALIRRAAELAPGRADLRVSFGLPPDAVVAATAARLVPGKGTDVLLQAVAVVPGLWLLVVGDGPERSALERCAVQLNVAARIVWAGRLPSEDMARAYAVADLFVLPSFAEGWGLAVNEAMACGLPVIVSSAVGCADDLIAGTGAGIVVPAGDVTALARAISEFAGDAHLRRRAAARAREVIARWTLAEEVAAIRKAIEVALAT